MNSAEEGDLHKKVSRWHLSYWAKLLAMIGILIGILLTICFIGRSVTGKFIDLLSKVPSVGTVFVGIVALLAACLGLYGVLKTIHSTEKREKENREAVDARERETARHERFTRIVEQLASPQATVRLGGLLAVSALADEWEREASKQIHNASAADKGDRRKQLWTAVAQNLAGIHQPSDHPYKLMHHPTGGNRDTPHQQRQSPKQTAPDARAKRVMTRDTVPLKAKDAIAQRDACLNLITTYLRTSTGPEAHPATETAVDGTQQANNLPKAQSEGITSNSGELITRIAAIAIIREHTLFNAVYPWPSRQIILSGAYLQGADLPDTYLQGADLSGAYLEGADLSGAHLEGTLLAGAHLENTNLSASFLKGSSISDSRLDNTDLSEAHMEGISLSKKDLRNVRLFKALLENADLSEAHLEGVRLSGARLKNANLSKAYLQGAQLVGAQLQSANLFNAGLENSHLNNAVLNEANLVAARLNNAQMDGVNLKGAKLEGADLTDARMVGGHLERANLVGAKLVGADFTEADLGTNDANNLVILAVPTSRHQVRCAHWVENSTQWPKDFDPEDVVRIQTRTTAEDY